MNVQPAPRRAAVAALAVVAALAGLAPAAAGRAARRSADGATATPSATVTPASGPGLCRVTGRQTVDSTQVEVGQRIRLALTLQADCPVEARGRADILLVYDRSASMAEDGKHEAALAAVQTFLDNVDFTRHRVGLVPFNDAASVIQTLTDRLDRLERALGASPGPTGSTDIARALEVADAELAATARREAVSVIVLLTDGRSNEQSMFEAAERARRRGTVIFTIGLGPDANQDALRDVASAPEFYDFAPGPAALAAIYQKVASYIREFTITDVHLLSDLEPGVAYVPASGTPFEPEQTGNLDWRLAIVPPGGVTVSYLVRMTRPGRIMPSRASWASYVDGDGSLRRFDFEPVTVDVVAPVIRSYYLPVLFRNQCLPATRRSDVVLAIDASSSMLEDDKLGQAVAGAKAFLRLLRLPADQAAIVTFSGEAQLVQPLTGDRALLEARLDALATQHGTRIDKAIDLALAELTGPRHEPRNQRVLVLLSDGIQVEEPGRVLVSASLARRLGMTVYAVGLGTPTDEATLLAVAGSAERLYHAKEPKDLTAVYTQVAGVVGCR